MQKLVWVSPFSLFFGLADEILCFNFTAVFKENLLLSRLTSRSWGWDVERCCELQELNGQSRGRASLATLQGLKPGVT